MSEDSNVVCDPQKALDLAHLGLRIQNQILVPHSVASLWMRSSHSSAAVMCASQY